MGICESPNPKKNINNNIEKIINSGFVPFEFIGKTSKSVCKLSHKNIYGTGFFMKYNSLDFLFTNYHIISKELINESIKLELHDKKEIVIMLKNDIRKIKFFEPPLDVTVIQIIEKDKIEDIDYLDYDQNYSNGFRLYKNENVFSSGYPFGEKLQTGIGHIINVDGYEFEHDIPTEKGSSGSPIILSSNQKIIGIHKLANRNYNQGTFIGAIIDELTKDYIEQKSSSKDEEISIFGSENSFDLFRRMPFDFDNLSFKTLSEYKIENDDESLFSKFQDNKDYSQDELRKILISNMLSIEAKATLFKATIKGDIEIFSKLIRKGFPILEEISPKNYYWTPLHYAMNYGKMEIVFYIIDKLKSKSEALFLKAMTLESIDKRPPLIFDLKTPLLCLLKSNVLSPYSIEECFTKLVEKYNLHLNEKEINEINKRNLMKIYYQNSSY